MIQYFISRPVVANAVMFGFLFLGIFAWQKIGKEEMPEFAMNWIRVSIRYPGAAAQDVESFITKPIEEKLKGISGLEEVSATSAFASATLSVTFEASTPNLPEKVQEVKDAVDSVSIPKEADDPVYRQFKSSEKAIIDIGLYLKDVEILDVKSRALLQKYALAFKDKILSLKEVSGIQESGYLAPELQVKVNPKLLEENNLSLNQVKNQIISQNIRNPIGSMKDQKESEVSIISELGDVKALEDVVVSAGFQGQQLRLNKIAKIENNFKESNSILKIQGHEGIIFNIQKSTSVDILTAQKEILKFMETFEENNKSSPIKFVIMDDESFDVRNRIDLISSNGIIGFLLIVIILFFFLDFKSGFWVAMGIPFSLAITLICAMLMGYTINNMTLASIIIVLGIVVDDAIIVAENIMRNVKSGVRGAVDSVSQMSSPVIASVLTTCAAFVPLYFFSGRFGLFVKYIPAIIFFMLLASLIESFFVLPSHMVADFPGEKFFTRKFSHLKIEEKRNKMTTWLEDRYESLLIKVLSFKWISLLVFVSLLLGSLFIYQNKLKYVMFPREESRDFRLKVVGPVDTKRYEMAKLVRKAENVFLSDDRGIVSSVRTSIGQNRRGGEVRENEASIHVEIVPASDRKESLNTLLKEWGDQVKNINDFSKVDFQRSRFGSSSGSPIVIQIQENNDEQRRDIADALKKRMDENKYITNVEIERPLLKQEYRLVIDKNETSRLGVELSVLSATLRSYIEGDILYTLNNGEEEVDVRFTSMDGSKSDINEILKLTVANDKNYLVPISNLVKVEKINKAANIARVNYKRTTIIYADLSKENPSTPLEIAQDMENKIFPEILKGYPTTNLIFKGEVEDSRNSQSDFSLSIVLVLGIIYVLLIFLFDSFITPLLIGAIIPFGVVGTVFAFWAHGMTQYGFFAVIGTLGMIGVVINDSIVLVDKLENSLSDQGDLNQNIAKISSTRLKAIMITTITTVAGLFPTAYGLGGYDSMLSEMMLAMGWGLLFGMFITLFLVPCVYRVYAPLYFRLKGRRL